MFRELDLPLADIRIIMENPTLDRGIWEMLLVKMQRIDHIIKNSDRMLKGDLTMDIKQFNEDSRWDMYKSMIEGMDDARKQSFIDYYGSTEELEKHMNEGFDSEQWMQYYTQAGGWYGNTYFMRDAWKDMPKPKEYVALQKKVGEVQRKLANLIETDACSEKVNELVSESESLVKALYMVDDPKDILLDIAKRYQEGGDMHESIDYMYGDGAASFIAKAITEFYGFIGT